MKRTLMQVQSTLGILPISLVNILLVMISISIVHFIGYFYGNFPSSFAKLLDPDFYLWFCFQFFLAVAIASLAARFMTVFAPFMGLFAGLTIASIVLLLSSEKKKWWKAILTYDKKIRYLDKFYGTSKVPSLVLGLLIFPAIYLGDEMWRFMIYTGVSLLVFVVYFVNTNFRSFRRFKIKIIQLSNHRNILNRKFTASFVLLLLLLLTAIAGSARFNHLVHSPLIKGNSSNEVSNFAIAGFIKGNPIKVKREGACLEFFLRVDEEIFREMNCKT